MQLRRHRTELVSRVHLLARIAQILLIAIGTGYWTVQIAGGIHYRQLADHNRLRKHEIEPPRGQVLDRTGRPLVENIPSYSLLIDRSRTHDLDASLDFAEETLGVKREVLTKRLDEERMVPRFRPVPLASRLTLEQLSRFAVHSLEHPEFETRSEQLRLYRYAHLTAHLLGYLGEVSDTELQQPGTPFSAGDVVGKKGIELLYDEYLRGQAGEQVVVVDSRGRTIDQLDRITATAGAALTLTIDLDLQQEAARLLEGKVGTIIALDPQNGEIRAMASSPSFDPNRFSRGLSSEDWQELIDHPHHPLQNRAVQNTYPPGSVFKIVMTAAALEEKVVDPSKKFFCRGFSTIYDHRYRCWKPSGHGWVDMRQGIKYSCNVYFHQLGQMLDIDTIADYSRRFGLGRRTGIDLDGEKTGLVPDREWSQRRRRQPWYPGETISVATGQGPLLVTPLQIARLTAAVANGGHLVMPHLLMSIDAGGERLPSPLETKPPQAVGLSPATLAKLQDSLLAVVQDADGTGRSAAIPGFQIAGKTGTAQVVRQVTWTTNDELVAEQRDHAWFASYGPAEKPRLVVVVFIEHGGGGSRVAAPLAKAIYEKYLATDLAHRAG